MKISKIVPSEIITTNIVDDTPVFNNTEQREYVNGETLQNNIYRYKRTGDNFTPPNYEFINEIGYEVGDIIFKDGFIQRVTSRGEVKHKKMPNDYSSTKITLDTTETSRYVELGDFKPTTPAELFNVDDKGYTYRLFENVASPTGYTFEVFPIGLPLQAVSSTPTLYLTLEDNPIEILTDCRSATNTYCSFKWTPNTLIVQNGKLYTLTQTAVELEYYSTYHPVYEIITSLDDFSGFEQQYLAMPYQPFDSKNYTEASRGNNSHITYRLKASANFDCVAVAGVNGIDPIVEVTFYDSNLVQVGNIESDTVETRTDINGLLPRYGGMTIIRADNTINAGYTDLKIDADTVGTIALGITALVGETKIPHSKGIRSFSGADYDIWGNMEFIERARILTMKGNITYNIQSEEILLNLMLSLDQNIVIFDGSDTHNEPIDNINTFGKSRMIGRLSDFESFVEEKDNGVNMRATSPFKVEQIV